MHGRGIKNHRIYREDNFSYWIERKDRKPYLDLLEDIAHSVSFIFPEDNTINPYDNLNGAIKKQMDGEGYKLFEKLVHALTLLNHPYRVFCGNHYISSREDVLLAARLMQPLAMPTTLMRRKTKQVYLKLLENFQYKPFTTREASLALLVPKSTMGKHLYSLLNCGHIEKAGGNRKTGYLYSIK